MPISSGRGRAVGGFLVSIRLDLLQKSDDLGCENEE